MPFATTTLACLLGSLPAGLLHPGPPIWAEILVGEAEAVLTVHAEPDALARFLGEDAYLVGPHEPEEEERLANLVREVFADDPDLSFDGEPQRWSFQEVRFPQDTPDEDGWLVAQVELRAPFENGELPRTIGLRWEHFEGTDWGGEEFVPVTVRHGRLPEVFSVWPKEPELLWHAPRTTLEAEPVPSVTAPISSSEPLWNLPTAALGALVLGAGLVLLSRRSAASKASAGAGLASTWAIVVVAITGAYLVRDVWVVPVGQRGPRQPTAEEARTIFERLHAGVYRAFEAKGEGEIYDLLAACVGPELVAPLYGDVYESLILREDGGALCAIEGVDLREGLVSFPDDGPAFQVEADWDVRGIVSHYGHIHRRKNTYRARYDVGLFSEKEDTELVWKIAVIDVLQFERVEE